MKNDIKLREQNSSKTYYTGRIITTNNCGKLTILGQTIRKDKSGYSWFLCRFDTGTVVEASASNLRLGNVHDYNHKTIYGIACMGVGIYTYKTHKKEYYTWNNMIKRGYSKTFLKRRPTYKDCTVDPRWHNFQNFCEDIQELEGYAEWKADNNKRNKYDLDKDIKVKGNKVYSKDTCMFVLASENRAESCLRTKVTGKTYKAINTTTGEEVTFTNQSAFHRQFTGKNRMGSIFPYTKGNKLYQGIWKIEELMSE